MTTTGARLVLLLALVVGSLSGCGSASPPSPPAGVDGLVIPTPSPDPSDFVATVDNPWFPLAPGSSWTYEVADGRGDHRLRVAVLPQRREVARVETTAVESREQGRTVVDYYAQDTAGNVWWFGRRGSWLAGSAGAEAGTVMFASPRVGDGFREGYRRGVMEDVGQVASIGGRVDVPAGQYADVVRVEVRSRLQPGVLHQVAYARGVGPVEELGLTGDYRAVRLLRYTRP